MLLTKKLYASWRDIQDEYEDYMTSLGPWDADSVLDFLRFENPDDPHFTETRVRRFLESEEIILTATD
jgi:hypothetical protein